MTALQGFEEISTEIPTVKMTLTVMDSTLRFNKGTAETLGFPAYVKILANPKTCQIAVQPCTAKESNAVKFSKSEGKQTTSVNLKDKALLDSVKKFFTLDAAPEGEVAYQIVTGSLLPNTPNMKVAVFTASNAVSGTMKRRGRKKASEA
ncbi:hypothetical protein [uncultured Bifidobacterium sp.]|uniref:hypothetical protein n=1 Tax=uncultured Bifidobacterium sp. TaxID=165187 RepID=UPI00263418F5|nr:hypothetical protein [uncultured Bifidobacterium sp.]